MQSKPFDTQEIRKKAELYMRDHPVTQIPSSESDTRKLLHELQVHQIELFMQNEDLLASRAETERLLDRFSELYDFSPTGYFTLSFNGIIAEANLTGSALLGIERKNIIGKSFVQFVSEQQHALFRDFLDATLAVKQPPAIELQLNPHNATQIYVHIKSLQEQSKNQVLISVTDISELKQIEAQRQALLIQSEHERKLKALGEFSGWIAHDFNNLLAIVLGNVNSAKLKLGNSDNNEIELRLDNAITAIEDSKHLIQQIISFSHQGPPESKACDLNLLIEESFKLFQSGTPSTLVVKLENPDRPLVIDANRTQIQEVFLNILNNAAHSMNNRGAVEVALTLRDIDEATAQKHYVETGKFAVIRIKDTGHGMTAEVLEKIFDPFFTTKRIGEGSGMGLAASHGIIRNHGGFISVESTVNKGSVFDIYLPLTEAQPEQVALPRSTEIKTNRNARILLIDDEVALLDIWSELLRDHGYDVTSESDSEKALELFKLNPQAFDIVISDQSMPTLCGFDLLKGIKNIRPGIPAILCSGYIEAVSKNDAQESIIQDFLTKPIRLNELLESILRNIDY